MNWWQRLIALLLIMASLLLGLYFWTRSRVRRSQLPSAGLSPASQLNQGSGEELVTQGFLRKGEAEYFIESNQGANVAVFSPNQYLGVYLNQELRVTGQMKGGQLEIRKIEVLE